jgi:hypothetical protein
MSVIYALTLAQDRLQAVIDAFSTGGGPPVLIIGTSALAGPGGTGILLSFILDDPVGTITTRRLNFSGMPKDTTASVGGVAAKAEIRSSDDVVWVSGLTVGVVGSGANVTMDTVSLTVTRPVRLVSAYIDHP